MQKKEKFVGLKYMKKKLKRENLGFIRPTLIKVLKIYRQTQEKYQSKQKICFLLRSIRILLGLGNDLLFSSRYALT